MKTKLPVSLIAFISLSLSAMNLTPAYANDDYKTKVKVVVKSQGARVKTKTTSRFSLESGWTHVTRAKIKVRSQIPGLSVLVNGSLREATYFPGVDPHYLVPINETIDAIDVLGGVSDCILDGIYLEAYDHPVIAPRGGSLYGAFPSNEIREIIESVDALNHYLSLKDQMQFTQPIKVAAGRALALAYGRGEVSVKTGQAISALIAQIDFAKNFLEEHMAVDATYGWTVKLLTHKERMTDMID